MRTDTDDLPAIDPARTHLDIIRDVLRMMENYQPTVDGPNDQGYLDCAECGFPLNGNVKPGLLHSTFKDHLSHVAGCNWLRGIAELQAWVRVEERLEEESESSDR